LAEPEALRTDSAPHAAGVRFGRFRLIERIGKGGMAEVFRAVSQGLQGFERVFVIKRIRPDRTDSAKFIEMFCDEARISALLHHPNIVQVYDFGQIEGAYFMAMEHLDGKDLATVQRALGAKRGALPPALAALVARDVARALHHAHTLVLPGGAPGGIVHRDVSPSNILLLRAGGVKILDFGIAKAAAEAQRHVRGNPPARPLGKLAYLSPEQVRGQALDARSDIFSLGIVLWEMVAGQRLFPGKDELETMRNVLLQPLAPPSRRRAGIPAALDAIVARALVRDPAGRYASAAEMADDLDRLLGEMPCGDQVIPQLLKNLFDDGARDRRLSGEEPVSATFSASGSAPLVTGVSTGLSTAPDTALDGSAQPTELDAVPAAGRIPHIRLVTAILLALAAVGWTLFVVLSY
jgi:serine/threonine-protein kinase